eukprot:CAMPEP_0116964874 /NCGR_PEP_ID=MMETSP0467-20121206/48858_1 /TAXON_ID=283647 /ORGANISM="Mesodinium pulex, Strain SPMC105" /LENGTH=81 /DNA_ID=CAMNT_0004653961 /DNA_START=92 /DNA_END=334 /DNA_ORIENTATION=-
MALCPCPRAATLCWLVLLTVLAPACHAAAPIEDAADLRLRTAALQGEVWTLRDALGVCSAQLRAAGARNASGAKALEGDPS